MVHAPRRDDTLPGGYGPPGYAAAQAAAERVVRMANLYSKGSGFSFFLLEARADPVK